jgi:hypothetical protein
MCAQLSASCQASGISGISEVTDVNDDADLALDEFAARLRFATLRIVWQQWQALGAETAARNIQGGRALQTLIDPEALLLVSLVLMSDECGLAELLHEWGKNNSALLSVQRTRKLAAAYPARTRRQLLIQLGGFAIIARDKGNDRRWRSVVEDRDHRDCPSLNKHVRQSRVTMGKAGRAVSSGGPGVHSMSIERDGPGAASGSTPLTRVHPIEDAALTLRLRQGFGVGVKADVLAYLLARADEQVSIREICEAAACSPAVAHGAAEELAAARLVTSLPGQPPSYRATQRSWEALLGLENRPPRWADWSHRFVFATALLHWAETTSEWPTKSSVNGARERNLVEHYRSLLQHERAVSSMVFSQRQDTRALLRLAMHELTRWLDGMA